MKITSINVHPLMSTYQKLFFIKWKEWNIKNFLCDSDELPNTKSMQASIQISIAVRPSAFGELEFMLLKMLTRTRKSVIRRAILLKVIQCWWKDNSVFWISPARYDVWGNQERNPRDHHEQPWNRAGEEWSSRAHTDLMAGSRWWCRTWSVSPGSASNWSPVCEVSCLVNILRLMLNYHFKAGQWKVSKSSSIKHLVLPL